MKNILVTIAIVCMSITAGQVNAQYTKIYLSNKDYVEMDPNIDPEVGQELINTAELLLNQYNMSGKFTNPGSGSIDEELVSKFRTLFTNNATHFNDIQNIKENIPVNDYTNRVYDYLSMDLVGMEYDLTGELVSISQNASGNYIIKLNFYKSNKIQLSNDYKVLPYNATGIPYTLNAIIEASEYDPTDAKFTSINGEVASALRSSYSILTIGANYGVLGNLSPSTANGFVDVIPTTSNYGVDISYLKSIGESQKWFISGGLRANFLNIETDFTGKYVSQTEDNFIPSNVDVTYYEDNLVKSEVVDGILKVDSIESGQETIDNANLISLRLGLARKIDLGENRLMLNIGLVANRLVNVTTGSRSLNYLGRSTPINPLFPNVSELTANGVIDEYSSNEVADQSPIVADPNFSIGVVFSPTYQMRLNYKYGLEFGLDYHYGITNLFKFDQSAEVPLLGANAANSILQDYLPNSKFNNLNLKAGFYILFN